MTEPTTKKRSDKRQRTKRLHVRLLPQEYAHLSKCALAVPMKRGDYIRALILGKRIEAKRIHPQPFYRHFYALANNFNQLMKKINSGDVQQTAQLDVLIQQSERCLSILRDTLE